MQVHDDPTPNAGFVHDSSFRVRYAESDQMGYAHHSAFVVWAEQGRVDWLRSHGYSYRSLEEAGVLLPVAHISLRYRRPGRFEDLIVVRTALVEAGVCRVVFENQVFKRLEDDSEAETGKDVLLAEVRVELATVGVEGRVRRLPKDLAKVLHSAVSPTLLSPVALDGAKPSQESK